MPLNQRLSSAPTTHRTRSLREQESAFAMIVARRQEHQASTALKVSAILVWLPALQAHWRELSQWIMGGLRQCRSSSSWIVTRSIPHGQWIRFRRKEWPVHGGQCYNAVKGACKASIVTWIAQGSVTGNKGISTDSEKALKSAVAQQPVSIIEAGDKDANRKRSCSLKTFVERHGAQTKASDVRINLLASVSSFTARTGIIKDSHSQAGVARNGAREYVT